MDHKLQTAVVVAGPPKQRTHKTKQNTARRGNAKKSGCGMCLVTFFGVIGFLILIGVALLFVLVEIAKNNQGDVDGELGQAALPNETRVDGAYIGLFIIEELSPEAQIAFDSAAARWSAIVGGTLPLIGGESLSVGDTICNGNFLVNETDLVLDHLMIAARVGPIDGRGGVLGFAGPCGLDSASGFPLFGQMVFDVADVNELIADDVLNFVILHEMGHVLGIGTLWAFSIQGEIVGNVPQNLRLIQDPILGRNNFGETIVLQTTEQPKFVGTGARNEFDLSFGSSGSAFVPIEDGTLNGQELFPAGRQTGSGSIDGHFDLEPLDNELMTFRIDPNEAEHPLSRISLASLADMGYVVDLNLADSFLLNRPTSKKHLRGHTYYMKNDMGLFLD